MKSAFVVALVVVVLVLLVLLLVLVLVVAIVGVVVISFISVLLRTLARDRRTPRKGLLLVGSPKNFARIGSGFGSGTRTKFAVLFLCLWDLPGCTSCLRAVSCTGLSPSSLQCTACFCESTADCYVRV